MTKTLNTIQSYFFIKVFSIPIFGHLKQNIFFFLSSLTIAQPTMYSGVDKYGGDIVCDYNQPEVDISYVTLFPSLHWSSEVLATSSATETIVATDENNQYDDACFLVVYNNKSPFLQRGIAGSPPELPKWTAGVVQV